MLDDRIQRYVVLSTGIWESEQPLRHPCNLNLHQAFDFTCVSTVLNIDI